MNQRELLAHAPCAAIDVSAMPEESSEDMELLRSLGYVGATSRDRIGDVVTFSGHTDPGHCQ